MPPFSLEHRRRRNRRLTILGLVLVLVVGGFVSLSFYMRARNASAAQQRVVDSATAYEQEDYARVIELLEDTNTNTNTIRQTAGDPAAMWRYVIARQEVELRNGEHFGLLFPALRQVVALDPGNLEAGHLLLEMLMGMGRNTEALETASRLITAHPDEVDLLRIRYALNMQLSRTAEALEDALLAAEAEPLDVRTQMDVATLMQELNHDATEFHQRAEALLEANPDDPRAEFILSRAWLLEGYLFEAQQLLESASQREAPDEDFVRVMVKALDNLGRYEESLAYLKRCVGPGLEGSLMYEVFFRDFENENNQATIDRAATLELSKAHPNILALAAISHKRLGNDDAAQQLLEELSRRVDDALAQHWSACLNAQWQQPLQPGQLVAACSAACDANPNHAYLHYLLAEAYRSIGELEAAIAELKVTHQHRPSWGHPYYLDAEMLLTLGRPAEAETAAANALRRRPILLYATTLGVARAQAANGNDQAAVDRALTYIDDKVQAQHPNEPRTYAAAVALLARTGSIDQADQRIRTALRMDPPLPRDTLLALAATSRNYGLNLDSALYNRARTAYGEDPRVVFEQALLTAKAASNEDAIELMRSATPTPAPLPWRVAEAQLLEQLGDPDAEATWVRLADDFPADLEIQRIALAAVGVRSNRAFADRLIKRMQSLAGDDSVGWKIERARYLLGSEDPAGNARAASELLEEVIRTAPNRVEPYRLLAHCQTLRNDPGGATSSIERAATLNPSDMRIQFQLGQMLHNQRQWITARQPLLRVARNQRADPNLRLNALILLSRQDEVDTLIPILEGLRDQYVAPDQQEILLAQLYLVTGRSIDADEICELMLTDPTPSAIAYAANYYWHTGRPEESSRVAAMANEVEMTAEVRHTILGEQAARLGQVDDALDHFRAAANAAPTAAGRWRNLVIQALVFGRPEVAVADARQALEHVPDDAGLLAIAENAPLLNAIATDGRFRPLAATIAGDPQHREVGLRALRLIYSASQDRGSTAAVARDLANLANQHHEYLALQNLSAALLVDVRAYEPASEIATRTMNLFPADGISARLATVSLAENGDWRRAISASQSWARRSPSQRPLADVYLSAAQRNLGRVDDALQTLEPHLDRAQADPDRHRAMLGEYATALIQRGRIEQAWDMLKPYVERDVIWRELAMRLAGSIVPNSDAASRWFDAIEAEVPADALQERLYFAQSVFGAGARLGDPALVDRARVLIDQATQRADAPMGAWFLRGQIADLAGDLAASEASYRQVLQLQPDMPLAKNNLAMILSRRGRDLDEAIELAQSACASMPGNLNLQDTLARVLSRAGRHEDALRTIDRTIQSDLQNLQWQRTKADLLEAAGRDDEAQQLRQRLGIGSAE